MTITEAEIAEWRKACADDNRRVSPHWDILEHLLDAHEQMRARVVELEVAIGVIERRASTLEAVAEAAHQVSKYDWPKPFMRVHQDGRSYTKMIDVAYADLHDMCEALRSAGYEVKP